MKANSKIIIGLATVLILAAVYVVVPVYEASTVHTTIGGKVAKKQAITADTALNNAVLTLVTSSTTNKGGTVCITVTDDGTPDALIVQVDTVGDGAATSFRSITPFGSTLGIDFAITSATTYQCLEFAGFGVRVLDDAAGNGVTAIRATAVWNEP